MKKSVEAKTPRTQELEMLRSRVADLERADTKHRHSREALRIKTDQLTAVTHAMTAFLETGNWREASAGLLRSALAQTDSEYGFIGVLVEGPSLRVLAHQGIKWNAYLGRELYEEALQMYQERGYLEFTSLENLFGKVLTGRRPIIANAPASDRRSGGLPPGHPPLNHFLGVPIFKGGDVVGMIGIANRPGGYSGSEQDKIEILCGATSVLYNSYRQQQRESELVQQRQEAEGALRQSEVRLQHALDAIEGGVWDWNLGTGHFYFSPRWSAMLGYQPGGLDPHVRTWEERLHPEDKPGVMQLVNDHLEGRKATYRSEHRMRTRSGDWIWVLGRGQVVAWDDDGKPQRMTGTDVDVTKQKQAETERRELQAQILRAQKLESLGVLAGGVAHDFNNLLTAILGHASLALEKLPPESPFHYELQQIETASLRAAELTSQMLAYSGRGKFIIEPIDLSDLVRETGRLLATVVSKHVLLKYELGEDLSLVEGDSSQLRQVVMNLITNASEAIGDNSGVIRIRTRAMEVDGNYLSRTYVDDGLPAGVYTFIEVSDTGGGIDGETRRRLFDPFFTTKFAGRGLGLASVFGIVRGHKGAIDIQSEPGSGTTFTVLFPSKHELEVHQADVLQGSEPRVTGTVLVVDDEEGVRFVSQRILEQCGFAVLSAKDGHEALDLFSKHQNEISVVLLDLTMPGMDGEDVFRMINQLSPKTPVVLSSGYNEQELNARFSEHGFAGFLQKPYQAQGLIAKLDSVLRLGR